MKILKINNFTVIILHEMTILEATLILDIKIPSFCYHPFLSLEGNCRMCLVEIENFQKPQASCCLPIQNNQNIFTNTPFVKKARENSFQFLLLNHPLDCPICDQGGECDLQDQSFNYGTNISIFKFNKRSLINKTYNLFIKTIMNRCIHCTRCIRFCSEYLGKTILGSLNRGVYTEIGSYNQINLNYEFTGNLIDICPVGALTSKPYSFTNRIWELNSIHSLDIFDSFGANLKIDFYKNEIQRILPNSTNFLNNIWINDRIRYCSDSFVTSRLLNPLYKNQKQYKHTHWFFILKFFKYLLTNFKTSTQYILPSTLDFYSLFLIKYQYKNFPIIIDINEKLLNLKIVNTFSFQYLFNSYSNTTKTQNFFLIGLNSRLEFSNFNLKLINQQQFQKLSIFSFGNAYSLLLQDKHLGYNIKKLKLYFFGQQLFCKIIKFYKNFMYLFNSNLFYRFDGKTLYILFSFLLIQSNKFNFNKLLNIILTTCNQTSLLNLGLKTNLLKKKKTTLTVTYQDFQHNTTPFQISFQSYLNTKIFKTLITLPISLYIEYTGYYINTMGFIQKNLPINTNITLNSKSNYKILKKLFFNKKNYKKNIYIKMYSLNYFSKETNFLTLNSTFFNYLILYLEPFSNFLENFYQTSVIERNSRILTQYSKIWINNLINFK